MANSENPTEAGISIDDVERALRAFDPNAPRLLAQLLSDDDPELKDAPAGTQRTKDLTSALAVARRKRPKRGRIKASTDVWRKFLTQKAPLPPRFKTGDIVTDLYINGGEPGRAMALRCLNEVPWTIGFFAAAKRIGKLAEERHDAVAFATVYGRIDGQHGSPSGGTRSYMAKRAWRYLRDLGRATPELFPWWAAEFVLHNESGYSRAASRITQSFTGKSYGVPPSLHEAWKQKPDPLFLIVQGAHGGNTVKQAWAALKKLHPDAAKEPSAAWVKTLISDERSERHDIFVEIAKKSPAFALAQLKSLGLGDAVLRLMLSSSKDARALAIEYARAHAADLSAETLIGFARKANAKEVHELCKELLTAKKPRDLGPALLRAMLAVDVLKPFAEKSLLEAFTLAELGDALVVDLAYDDDDGGHDLFIKLDKKHGLSAALWKRVLEDPRLEDNYELPDEATEALAKIGATAAGTNEIGGDWLLDIVVKQKDKLSSRFNDWLEKAKAFPSLTTDAALERVKGLLFDRELQEFALAILGNKHLVDPKRLGIPWLLALAKRKDATLQQFANRTLLESMGPEDFAGAGDKKAGEARLFEMALSPSESELLRKFAQTYLRCHHPEIGEQQAESKLIGLKPQLKREAYSIERLWSGLRDVRDDVRKFAVAIAKIELRRWNAMGRLGEIADTDAVDVRRLALDAMLKADDPAADPACTAKVDELLPEVVFPLTESRRRPVREAGMELIRRHYTRLGGQERLAWLMTTADREVRLFAVRILWEKHRPRAFPKTWQPKVSSVLDVQDRFADDAALQRFLRRVLFALPPGRSMEAREDGAFKRISSSVAKRRVVEIVRDLAVDDAEFAALARPILTEMTASIADGEWQACLQALCAIDAKHGRPHTSATTSQAAE